MFYLSLAIAIVIFKANPVVALNTGQILIYYYFNCALTTHFAQS